MSEITNTSLDVLPRKEFESRVSRTHACYVYVDIQYCCRDRLAPYRRLRYHIYELLKKVAENPKTPENVRKIISYLVRKRALIVDTTLAMAALNCSYPTARKAVVEFAKYFGAEKYIYGGKGRRKLRIGIFDLVFSRNLFEQDVIYPQFNIVSASKIAKDSKTSHITVKKKIDDYVSTGKVIQVSARKFVVCYDDATAQLVEKLKSSWELLPDWIKNNYPLATILSAIKKMVNGESVSKPLKNVVTNHLGLVVTRSGVKISR